MPDKTSAIYAEAFRLEGEVKRLREALAAARRQIGWWQAYADNLRGAADRLLQLWADYTSQEMYGEHLRDGMGDDFSAWEEAHDYLRKTSDAARVALAAPGDGEEGTHGT